ncbi:HAMP domain-containing protein [Brevibacillus sp. SYP-B805]|uniref:methyl-accepting chemotaxis protein n=1 Tax=Brevibacillus sp. SYP-B805 TaxID=1578199 RepID=UPI0013EAB38E|nr:methyl-accepting chemotaxis protein [Brevibacillus sp. SYP-B805]NGQ95936.1 HAMP domain-containing protein [Brevibacillus sp. SYP-B805]
MQFLRNCKISTKIMVLQIVVVAFMLAVGITGYVNLSKIRANSEEMYQDKLLSIQWLNDIRSYRGEIESYVLELIVTEDSAQKETLKKGITEMSKKTDDLIKQYEASQLDELEQRKFAEYKNALKAYRDELLIVEQEADLNHQKDAYEEYVSYLYAMRTRVTTLLNELVAYNIEASKQLNQESTRLSDTANLIMIGITLLAVVFSVLVGTMITRMITRPLKEIQEQMTCAGTGDLRVKGTYQSQDEIGMLTADFNKMVTGLREVVEKVNDSANNLSARAGELATSAEQTVHVANQIAASIQEVATGAEAQAVGAAESVKAMSEMAVGIERIAESSSAVSETSAEAAQQAAQGNEIVQKVVQQMDSIRTSVSHTSHAVKELGARSEEIGQIVGVISDIAAQTNLLALNAAIEAARAGEHGRGFAVVADEVRKLAEQSRQSADQIANLIQEIQADTERVVSAIEKGNADVESGIVVVREAGEAFQKIMRSVRQVADQIQEVSAASEEMSAGTEEVTASVEEMARIARDSSENSQSVVASSQEQLGFISEISSSVQSLREMARELQELVKQFKL